MVSFFKTVDGRLERIHEKENGCWINVINPSEEEIEFLCSEIGTDRGFIRSALDEEEASRVENEEDQTLIIIDVPIAQKAESSTLTYYTLPMGIILSENYIITLSSRENSIIKEFSEGLVKNVKTELKTQFLLLILLRVAGRFLQYLKQIDKLSNYVEKQLHKSQKNKELIQLLDLEKSMVFFSTSLKSDEITLEKILRGRCVRLYEEDQDLLEDVIIEVKQAIEMSNIYSSILSGTMDAFASVISNNLNIVMRILTSLTILLAIPTMIYSFYGMNVKNLPLNELWWFPLAFSAVITVLAGIWLKRKQML